MNSNITHNQVEYKHVIAPIKTKEGFYPNLDAFVKTRVYSKFNMLLTDFLRHQRLGKTILVNNNGGWCTL